MAEDGNDWKVAGRGKKKRNPAIGGTNTESSELKGVPPRNFWQFSVTRLDEKTTDDAVRRVLHLAGVEVREIWMLNSKIKGTRTAKIRVAREHREKAKNQSIWPLHCQIRDWEFGRRKGEVAK